MSSSQVAERTVRQVEPNPTASVAERYIRPLFSRSRGRNLGRRNRHVSGQPSMNVRRRGGEGLRFVASKCSRHWPSCSSPRSWPW
jgi:hypothetical protein